MTRLGMVIDLARCVGCGACAFACKTENNTRTRGHGQSFNWADFVMQTEGTFPNVTHMVMPVLCNHCSDAPCIKVCPGNPTKAGPGKPYKALFKTPEGITLHDPELCVGCGDCQKKCPYSHEKLDDASLDGQTYSVISLNPMDEDPQPFWTDKTAAIPGCTASGAETAAKAGVRLPAMTQWQGGETQPVRSDDVVEKCTFCYHRVTNGLQPACVEVCPSQARIFGDQEDPNSKISQVLKKEKSFRLKEEAGTKPNVHYIGKYAART
ncbi:MAG: 4Fe-4S dicluster domain-containing protein [Burkholderiales bacterium]|nr:4Fe-4S dicluster domain-containing protein [Burkholderiales bacterium]